MDKESIIKVFPAPVSPVSTLNPWSKLILISSNKFEKVDFIGTDVSFISLTAVLDKAHELLKQEGEMVVLIKPQKF